MSEVTGVARVQHHGAWCCVTQRHESADPSLGNTQYIQHLMIQRGRGQMINGGSFRVLQGTPQIHDNMKQLSWAEMLECDIPYQGLLRE